MGDDSGEREVGRFNVEVALHNLEVWCDGAQEIERLFVGKVSEAENLTDLARSKKLFELWGRRLVRLLKRKIWTFAYLGRYVLERGVSVANLSSG